MQDIMFVDTQHYTFYSWQALEHHARILTDQLLGVPAAHICPRCPRRGLPWPSSTDCLCMRLSGAGCADTIQCITCQHLSMSSRKCKAANANPALLVVSCQRVPAHALSWHRAARLAGEAPCRAASACMHGSQPRGDVSPAVPCCAGLGTRSIYSMGRLQSFYRSEESRRYHLAGLRQLERDWVQHQRQIPADNIIWGWPQRWYQKISRPAS